MKNWNSVKRGGFELNQSKQMVLARVSLILSALALGGFGLWFLADPVGSSRLVGINLGDATARIDFRATYGGLNVALGILLAMCAFEPSYIRGGLWVQALVAAGYGGGRLLAMALEGQAPRMMVAVLGSEAFLLLLAVASLWRLGRS